MLLLFKLLVAHVTAWADGVSAKSAAVTATPSSPFEKFMIHIPTIFNSLYKLRLTNCKLKPIVLCKRFCYQTEKSMKKTPNVAIWEF